MSSPEYVPLQHNESYWLLNDELVEAYQARSSEQFSRYPDYAELLESIAAYAGMQTEHVCLGAGSDSLIEIFARQLARAGKRAILPVPTFYGYEHIFQHVGLSVDPVYYTERQNSFEFPLEETKALMSASKDSVLFLCQPNNPLGCDIPQSVFNEILDFAIETNTCVVSDEAYFEFSGLTAIDRVLKQDSIIFRTFSKGFGLSGARVGYSVASPTRTYSLREEQLPWPVAHTSVFAALRALELKGRLAERVKLVKEEREHFREELQSIPGVLPYPSATNFVLIKVPDVTAASRELKAGAIGFAKTDFMSSFPSAKALLSSTIRLSVPSPAHRERVLTALRAAVDN